MKKQYKIEVDCGNCAAKIEDAIGKTEGVIGVSINYMMQKMTLEWEDSIEEKTILKTVLKVGRKIERDFEIR